MRRARSVQGQQCPCGGDDETVEALEQPREALVVARELIPSVDAQGRLCQIVLQPNHYSNRTILVGKQVVTGEEIEGILDLLVPMKERGKKEKGWGDTALMGQMYATHYPFERVEVVLSGALNFEPSSDSPSKPSPDDIAKGKLGFSSAEVATISWPDRKCVQ